MENSESGDDIGASFLSADSQGYMVQGDELDGKKPMFIASSVTQALQNSMIFIAQK